MMNVTVERRGFKKAVGLTGTAIPPRTIMEEAGHVHLCASDGGWLDVTCSGMGVALRYGLEAKVHKPGSLLLPQHVVSGLCDLPGSEIEIRRTGKRLWNAKVQAGGAAHTVKGLDPIEFPLVRFGEDDLGRMSANSFIRAVGWALSSTARTEERPVLGNVFICVVDGKTHFVGTDGHRLGMAVLNESGLDGCPYLIPSKPLRKVWKLYRGLNLEPDTEVAVRQHHSSLTLDFGEVRSSHLLASYSHYIDYLRMLPVHWKIRVVVNLDELLAALKLTESMTKRRDDFYKTVFVIKQSESGPVLLLMGFQDELGDASTSVPLVKLEGEDPGVGGFLFLLNGFWVRQTLRALHGAANQVAIEATTPNEPFIFRPVGASASEWEGTLSLQMPMADEKVIAHAEKERRAEQEEEGE